MGLFEAGWPVNKNLVNAVTMLLVHVAPVTVVEVAA
jgi:hypothetical protein